jgi:tRNA(fMet)-specific endonuclease VapC
MLDTNIVSELARNPQGAVARHIAEVGPDAVCVSIITAAELRYGCAKKGSVKLLAQIEAILGSIAILALDVPADTEYGGIRAELEAAGKPIGANDPCLYARCSAGNGQYWRV